MSDDVKLLKRGYQALNMLMMHIAGHANLREDRFDEYFDVITAILELANNERYRLRTWKPENK